MKKDFSKTPRKFIKKAKQRVVSADEYDFSDILKKATVLKVNSNYNLLVEIDGYKQDAIVAGRIKNLVFKEKNPIAVGYKVLVDTSPQVNRVVKILSAKNKLQRITNGIPTVIAANLDNVFIVCSYKMPQTKFSLIDRYLTYCKINGINSIICINKMDFFEKDEVFLEKMKFYQDLGIETIFISAKNGDNIDRLKNLLYGKISIFTGQSGVGKSSIINKIDKNLNIKTGKVSLYNKRGVHTTSAVRMYPFSFSGYLVDSAGIKTFALSKDDLVEIARNFPGFKKHRCKFNNCIHINQTGCKVEEAVEKGKYPYQRYFSYKGIINEIT